MRKLGTSRYGWGFRSVGELCGDDMVGCDFPVLELELELEVLLHEEAGDAFGGGLKYPRDMKDGEGSGIFLMNKAESPFL